MKLWHCGCKPRLETDVTQKVNRADVVFRQTDPDLVQTVKIPGLFRSLPPSVLTGEELASRPDLPSQNTSLSWKRCSPNSPTQGPWTMADLHFLSGRAEENNLFPKSHMLKELQIHIGSRAEGSWEDMVVTFHQYVHSVRSRAVTVHLSIPTLPVPKSK